MGSGTVAVFWEAVGSPSHGGLGASPGSASSVPLPKALPVGAAELRQGRAQEGTGDAPSHRGARARPGNILGTATSYRNTTNSCTSTPKEHTAQS